MGRAGRGESSTRSADRSRRGAPARHKKKNGNVSSLKYDGGCGVQARLSKRSQTHRAHTARATHTKAHASARLQRQRGPSVSTTGILVLVARCARHGRHTKSTSLRIDGESSARRPCVYCEARDLVHAPTSHSAANHSSTASTAWCRRRRAWPSASSCGNTAAAAAATSP